MEISVCGHTPRGGPYVVSASHQRCWFKKAKPSIGSGRPWPRPNPDEHFSRAPILLSVRERGAPRPPPFPTAATAGSRPGGGGRLAGSGNDLGENSGILVPGNPMGPPGGRAGAMGGHHIPKAALQAWSTHPYKLSFFRAERSFMSVSPEPELRKLPGKSPAVGYF